MLRRIALLKLITSLCESLLYVNNTLYSVALFFEMSLIKTIKTAKTVDSAVEVIFNDATLVRFEDCWLRDHCRYFYYSNVNLV